MTQFDLLLGDTTVQAHIDATGAIVVDGAPFEVTTIAPGIYRVRDGSRTWQVAVANGADDTWVSIDGRVARIEVADKARGGRSRSRSAQHDLSAPMPATVVKILVAPGDVVTRGQTMLMLEAMKMELPIRAPRDGAVKTIRCQLGELVQPGVALLELA